MKKNLQPLRKVIVAYSGGVDSTFLLRAAVEVLGADNVLACIGISPSLGENQYRQAIILAQTIGASLREIKVDELDDPRYAQNKADRCFHCKTHLYKLLTEIAKENGFENIICGSNLDDMDDFRPGSRAAKAFGIKTPLAEARLTKKDIRTLSRNFNLPTAQIPASPCLASRIAYGLEINAGRLKQIEKAEDFLRQLGFVEFRVRHHDTIARIEVPQDEIQKITAEPLRSRIEAELKKLGFKYVTVDLTGFRSGSLNESLTDTEKQKASRSCS
ncbi:MAG: ATP-dependent sacrificial sulfur transferase LarE [Planctomycetota bacterium]